MYSLINNDFYNLDQSEYNIIMSKTMPEQQDQEALTHSPKQLQGDLARRFQFIGVIGEGTFGMVSAVYDKQKKKKLALKKIKLNRKHQGLPAASLREVVILKSMNHPNIVKIEDVFYDCQAPRFSFTLELHPHNLHDILRKNHLSVKKIKKFSRQLLLALQYLHRRGVIHRDLKPQNVLITSEDTLKLCDFGQAKLTLLGENHHTPDISTLWYRSPEILLGSLEYGEAIDAWAAGCIIAEMVLGKPLFRGNSEVAMIFCIFQLLGTPKTAEYAQISKMQFFSPTYPKFEPTVLQFEGLSKEGEDFLRRILVVNPQKRMSIQDALRHQFICTDQE